MKVTVTEQGCLFCEKGRRGGSDWMGAGVKERFESRMRGWGVQRKV